MLINIHKKTNVKVIVEILYCIQIICKHNKNRLNEFLEDEMVEEQCCLERDPAVATLQLRCNR